MQSIAYFISLRVAIPQQIVFRCIRPVFTALLLAVGYAAFAQNNRPLDQTLTNLQKQAADNPFEKVYLHTDKPYYGAGDTIWFKGYTVTGARHHLSQISGVLNVELIDEQNNIKRNIKLPLVAGITYGDFVLPDTLQEGSYRIRAYTNWMRNAGNDYFFDRTIRIINVISNKVFTQSSYSYLVQNGQQIVNADINYTNEDGKPYPNKEVKYEVELDSQRVVKGKGITNANGSLHITFTNPSPGTLKTGEIITNILLDEQRTITKIIAVKAATSKVDVQFFPESGYLVNGITSKIAFKAVGADGLGANIKGTITDELNNEVTRFSSTHLGMGVFTLTPQAGKNYKANITYADGTAEVLNLPKPADKGYVLTIDNIDTLNHLLINVSGINNDNQAGVTLIAQSGGEIYFEGKSKPGQANFAAGIPKNKFPSGIVQFTLFSNLGEPLNERLVFIQNPDKLKLSVNTAKQSYAAREKVKIELNAKDKDGQPIQGNFSASVTDESIVPVNDETESTILSDLLLSSDIKGYIEQPNYYFTNINAKTAADLDVLMLTQGYHRYEWKQVMVGVQPAAVFEAEKSINISGQVKRLGGKPVVKGKVSLFSTSDGIFLVDTVTDKNGRFTFNMAFIDSSKFTVKALSASGRENVDLKLDISPPLIKRNKNTADISLYLNKGLEPFIQNSRNRYEEEIKYGIGDHTILLKEININKIKPKYARQLEEEQAVEFSENLNGKGQADQVITAGDIEKFGGATLYDVLNGRLAGVEFHRDTNGQLAPFSIRSSNQLNGPAQPMAVVIDGTFGRDITLIPVSQIGSVEVLRTMTYLAVYGSRASNGVLVITSKHGQPGQIPPASAAGSVEYRPQGYYKALKFYSPQYDGPKVNMPDLRSTITWQPVIQTDKDGNAYFEYFNADGKGNYRVVIEGIDYKTGSLGRQVYRYKVE